MILSGADLDAWRTSVGWRDDRPKPQFVFQEPISGGEEYGLGLVRREGVVLLVLVLALALALAPSQTRCALTRGCQVCCEGRIVSTSYYRLRVSKPLFVYGMLDGAGTLEFPDALPQAVADAASRIVRSANLSGFVNFDLKVRTDGRPAFLEANMRIAGSWLK